MEIDKIKALSNKVYSEVAENGINAIKKLFSKGNTLAEELRYDSCEEYLKRMLISQLDIDKMLLTHKYYSRDWNERDIFARESDEIREKVESETNLQFDDDTIEALFGNTLPILSEEDYEKWKEFVYSGRHGEKRFDDIFLEEEFKYNYENEKNPVKRIIQSFKHRKMQKRSALEDSYVKRVREMLREGIIENPNDSFTAYRDCHTKLEKGVIEYASLKDREDIARMTLISLTGNQDEIINIEEECQKIRDEMKNDIGTTRIGKEYRQRQVTLGSESGISSRPVMQTIPFEQVPNAMKNLQKEYEEAYNTEQGQEEYIRKIAKIYADFINIQPYEDGNKRTAMCLFNSMLLSKDIVPPPISLINNEQMVKAFYKVQDEKDYTMLQDIIVEQYKKMQSNFGDDKEETTQEATLSKMNQEKEMEEL